jgi:hypothetical protein
MSETFDETPAVEPQADAASAPVEPEVAAEPEAEAWTGPSREEWDAVQARAARADELYDLLQNQAPAYEEQEPQRTPLPELDPYDPESVIAYMEAARQQDRAEIAALLDQRLGPITNEYNVRSAEQWINNTFPRLGVPEGDHWKEGVLFTSAAFQPLDQNGRPTVSPEVAAKQGLEFLRKFAEAERAAEREQIAQQNQQNQEALRNRAESPLTPAGAAGVEGEREFRSLDEATRAWLEMDAARNAA